MLPISSSSSLPRYFAPEIQREINQSQVEKNIPSTSGTTKSPFQKLRPKTRIAYLTSKVIQANKEKAIREQEAQRLFEEKNRESSDLLAPLLAQETESQALSALLEKSDEPGESYIWPGLSGTVSKGADGSLASADNKAINSLFQYLNHDDNFKEVMKSVDISPGQKVTFSMPEEMDSCYDALSNSSEVQQVFLRRAANSPELEKVSMGEDEGEDEGEGVNTLIAKLLRVKEVGSKAFKDNARIDGYPLMSPYDALAQMVPTLSFSDNEAATNVCKETLDALKTAPHKAFHDYCAKTATEFALHRAQHAEQTWGALALSVALSATLGVLLEMMAGNLITRKIFEEKLAEQGKASLVEELFKDVTEEMLPTATGTQKFLTVLAHDWQMLPVESADTLVVLSALQAIREGQTKDQQKSGTIMKDALGRLPDALMAGAISVIGSLPDKAMELYTAETWKQIFGKLLPKVVTSGVSVLSCASGLFPELGEAKYKMQAALLEMHVNGDMAWPEGLDSNDPEAKKKYICALTESTLNIDPATGIGRASIMGALGISTVAAAASFSIPAQIMNVLNLVFFNPVETWTLNLIALVRNSGNDNKLENEVAKIANEVMEQVAQGSITEEQGRNRMVAFLVDNGLITTEQVDEFKKNPLSASGGAIIDTLYSGAGSVKNGVRMGLRAAGDTIQSNFDRIATASGSRGAYERLDESTRPWLSSLGSGVAQLWPSALDPVASWVNNAADSLVETFTPGEEDMRLSKRIPWELTSSESSSEVSVLVEVPDERMKNIINQHGLRLA